MCNVISKYYFGMHDHPVANNFMRPNECINCPESQLELPLVRPSSVNNFTSFGKKVGLYCAMPGSFSIEGPDDSVLHVILAVPAA